ncbi:MAG: hypothetical protein JWP91_3177 [Fibrobacteres bacterium]|nr:hypothetical protein [Fibrobacterota bacterium]
MVDGYGHGEIMNMPCCDRPRRNLSRISLWAALAALSSFPAFTGCSMAPARVVEYKNLDPDPVWLQGLEIHRYEGAGLEFASAYRILSRETIPYRGFDVQSLEFLVEVRNRSAVTVVIDPVQFALGPFKADSAGLVESYESRTTYFIGAQPRPKRYRPPDPGFGFRPDGSVAAIDPEIMIAVSEIDKDQARRNAENQATANAVIGLLDVTNVVLTSAVGTKQQSDEAIRAMHENDAQAERDEYRNKERLMTIAERKQAWADCTLRKTTLPPGGSILGAIRFPYPAAFSMYPDSLRMEFRPVSGPAIGLGRFRLRVLDRNSEFITGKPPLSSPPVQGLDKNPG